MALEETLNILEIAMHGKLDEIDESELKKTDVKDSLITFFAEQEKRPGLVSLIKIPELMHEYLELSLEEREELEQFNITRPTYLKGFPSKDSCYFIGSIKSGVAKKFAIKLKLTKDFLGIFYSYLPDSKQTKFNTKYIQKKEPGVYNNSLCYFRGEGHIDYIARIAAKEEPKILDYWMFKQSTLSIKDVLKYYIEHQPLSKFRLVSLKSFFSYYDAITSKCAVKRVCGKIERNGIPQGNKYVRSFSKRRKKNPNLTFEDFIKEQVPSELYQQLMKTPYYRQNKLSMEDILMSYIEHQPLSKFRLVSPESFFGRYDAITGKCAVKIVGGKKERNGIPQGNKYAGLFFRRRKKNPNLTFEDFIKEQVPSELYQQLMETPYYRQNKLSMEDILMSYIEHQPLSKFGLVPPKSFFCCYDAITGKCAVKRVGEKIKRNGIPQGDKYVRSFSKRRKKNPNLTFEDFIKEQVPSELYQQLMETPYYRQKEQN